MMPPSSFQNVKAASESNHLDRKGRENRVDMDRKYADPANHQPMSPRKFRDCLQCHHREEAKSIHQEGREDEYAVDQRQMAATEEESTDSVRSTTDAPPQRFENSSRKDQSELAKSLFNNSNQSQSDVSGELDTPIGPLQGDTPLPNEQGLHALIQDETSTSNGAFLAWEGNGPSSPMLDDRFDQQGEPSDEEPTGLPHEVLDDDSMNRIANLEEEDFEASADQLKVDVRRRRNQFDLIDSGHAMNSGRDRDGNGNGDGNGNESNPNQNQPGADAILGGGEAMMRSAVDREASIQHPFTPAIDQANISNTFEKAPASVKLEPAPVISQIVHDLAIEAASSASIRDREIQIQLHPVELGRLIVVVNSAEEQIKATIIASELVTSELLNREKEHLIAALKEQGIDLPDVNITYRDPRDQQQNFSDADTSDSVLFDKARLGLRIEPEISHLTLAPDDLLSEGATRIPRINLIA